MNSFIAAIDNSIGLIQVISTTIIKRGPRTDNNLASRPKLDPSPPLVGVAG